LGGLPGIVMRLKAGVKGALFPMSVDFSHIYADPNFMTKFLRSLLFIGCLGIILFFALKPDPEVPKAVAPSDVRVFFNTFDAFRNQLAFGMFGVATLLLLMGPRIFNMKQIVGVAAIAVLIPILEFAQIWMPTRHVDVDDVLNGWLGLGLACLLYLAARGFWKILTREGSKTDLATRRGQH
jgi:VanZ family protein